MCKVSIHRWHDVCLKRFLSFCLLTFCRLLTFELSYLQEDRKTSLLLSSEINLGQEIHNQKWRNAGTTFATRGLKKRVFGNVIVKKCCRLIFHCLVLSRGAEVFGLTHKAFHNASGALCTGKLTSTKQQSFVASHNTQTDKFSYYYLMNTVENSGLSEVWKTCWMFK